MKKSFHALRWMLGLIVVAGPSVSRADLTMKLKVSPSAEVTIQDNQAGDNDGRIGFIRIANQDVGNFRVSATTAASDPVFGTPTTPKMQISSLDVSQGSGTLVILLSNDGFHDTLQPVFQFDLGSSVTAGTVTCQAFLSAANTLFGQDTLLTAIGPVSGGFSGSSTVNHGSIKDPYALTVGLVINHTTSANTSLGASLVSAPGSGAAVGDFVWIDFNNDGFQDASEAGLNGVVVNLFDGANNLVTTQNTADHPSTSAPGYYLFTGLFPGNYRVQFVKPPGYGFSPKNAADPDTDSDADVLSGTSDLFNLPDGTTDLTWDAGLYQEAGLGDFVWNDYDRDGQQDADEPGIPNVTVELYNCVGNLIASNTTDANGLYLFTGLAPGEYKVKFVTPAGYVLTSANVGNDASDSDASSGGQTVCITLASGETNLTIDAGYYQNASLGDFVWFDSNANGLQDSGEPGIDGVSVKLYLCGEVAPIATTTTAGGGYYLFTNLKPGCYQVEFVLPAGYTAFSPKDAGDDAKDSDADVLTGKTGNCVLASGESNLTVDAGVYNGCDLLVTKECLIPPPRPTGFNCSDAKPIDSLSMVWGGNQVIGIKAWKGSVESTLLASIDGIVPGQKITVSGLAGSPNDIYWEIFSGSTGGAKLGESTFHVSCSDEDMNGTEDCGKWAGDGKGNIGYINEWIFEGMSGNGFTLSCTPQLPTPSATCEVMEAPFASCDTLGKPTSLTFRYTGGGCGAGNNPQDGKFTCSGAINPGQAITIVSANGYMVSPSVVQPGEDFTVSGTFASQSTFTISNSGGTETISIHTSCSQPLMVGDVFGSFTLVGFNGQMGGSSVIYRYTVANNGPVALNNIVLSDSLLGPITAPFSLPAGQSMSFDVPVQIEDTVVSTATAIVQGQNCEASSGPVQVTVLRNCPVPVPASASFDCSSLKPIDSVSMIWGGTQTIGVKAWKGTVGSTLLASINGIVPGQNVTITGFAGSPNDVYWEIFQGTVAGAKLGESKFHLSCSDNDMNGPEDCGTWQGDGKDNNSAYINLWVFEGLGGNGKSISCSTPPIPTPAAIIKDKKLEWELANPGTTKLTMTGLTLTWPAINGKLKKVKLDKDTVWDAGSPVGATSITLTSDDLTPDTKKKSIDPGKDRKLTLEFEADASSNLADYGLAVTFGKCTISLW